MEQGIIEARCSFDEEKHEGRIDGTIVPTVSQVNAEAGLSYEYLDNDINQRARQFGKALHAATALDDQDNLGYCNNELLPYLNGWRKFKKEFGIEFKIIEKRLYSLTRLFCGQPDRGYVFNWRGKNIIVDLKSGAPAISHQYQTAGYQLLVEENDKLKIHERWAVYLKPNQYSVAYHTDKNNRNTFLCALHLWWEKRKKVILL